MPRNPGADIDTATQRVRDRDGVSYPLDRMVLAPSGLFYSRPLGDANDRRPGQLFHYHQRWLLPAHGWSVSRLTFFLDVPNPIDWYIEPDIITVEGNVWSLRDAFLDVEVYEGRSYHVDDAHELAAGLRHGEIAVEDAAASLEALHELLGALKTNGFSGRALLEAYAPGLPAPDEMF